MITLKNNTLSLFWEGPFTVQDDRIFNEELPGLYLFSFKIKDYYSINYIGKSSMPLSKRLVGYQSGPITVPGHIREIMSGRYWLYYPPDMKNEVMTPVYEGGEYQKFFKNLDEYWHTAKENLESINYFLCTFNDHEDIIDYAEKLLIYHAFRNIELFPMLDNSKKTANHIFNEEIRDISIQNFIPKDVKLKGLSESIGFPKKPAD
jgi:hypothetical protein